MPPFPFQPLIVSGSSRRCHPLIDAKCRILSGLPKLRIAAGLAIRCLFRRRDILAANHDVTPHRRRHHVAVIFRKCHEIARHHPFSAAVSFAKIHIAPQPIVNATPQVQIRTMIGNHATYNSPP